MDEHPILDGRERRAALESMNEEDFEDFLTEAIGLYAEETRTPLERLQTFSEAKLLFKNRGLVVALESAEFRLSITKSR